MMDSALPKLDAELEQTQLHPSKVPLTSIDGDIVPVGTQIDPHMYVRHVRSPVRFASSLRQIILSFPDAVLLDVGPGRSLSILGEGAGMATVPLSPARGDGDDLEPLIALGKLWSLGERIDLERLSPGGRSVHLPGYSFSTCRFVASELRRQHVEPADIGRGVDLPTIEGFDASLNPPSRSARDWLADMWMDLLGKTELSDESDFFQLGGDSLTIVRLARRVKEKVGIELPIRDVMSARTLGNQAVILAAFMAKVGTDRTMV
jgi:acyl transferase domain-containing protein